MRSSEIDLEVTEQDASSSLAEEPEAALTLNAPLHLHNLEIDPERIGSLVVLL